MTAVTERPVRVLPRHHATRVGGEQRPLYVCSECLVLWPCSYAHRQVTRCNVCGQFWSEHTDAEYRLGCRRGA